MITETRKFIRIKESEFQLKSTADFHVVQKSLDGIAELKWVDCPFKYSDRFGNDAEAAHGYYIFFNEGVNV